MNIHEHQAKEILREFGASVSKGIVIYHLDEINADPAALNVFHICKFAKQKGIKVLLSGTGGDDLFSGYRRHKALSLEKYWGLLPKAFLIFFKKIFTSYAIRT